MPPFKFRQGCLELVAVGNAPVPCWRILHEAHTLSLGRTGNHNNRPAMDLICLVQHREDLGHVVSMYLDHMPVKGGPLVCNRLGGHDLLGRPSLLYPVAINDQRQVVEPVLGTHHHTFPNHAAVQFTIAQHDVRLAL